MADPIGGGLGKAAQQMMEQVQQQAQQAQKGGLQQGVESKFDVTLVNQGQQVQEAQKVSEATKAVDTLRMAKLNLVDPSIGVKPVEPAKETTQNSGVKRLMGAVMDGQNQLDQIIAKASSGKQFSNTELLAMQAGVYKFSQELELTSKVVEKATSGIKQTMQTQV
jgi:hypothetical protein